MLTALLLTIAAATAAPPETPQERFAATLEADYVLPEVGTRMAAAVRALDADSVGGEALATALTDAARSVAHDGHLYVRHGAIVPGAPRKDVVIEPPHAEKLDGGVGYLALSTLLDSVATTDAIDEAMRSLAGSRALVIDLRENRGGSGPSVVDVASWLFAERVHLNDLYWRVDWSGRRDRVESFHTVPRDDSPFHDVPVYVLVSKKTFSAAEALAYNLQQLKRATIVGEASGGGAHPVRFVSLGGGFNASIPVGRAINPVSGTNWEGVGVQPDVVVPAADALARVLVLARGKNEKSPPVAR